MAIELERLIVSLVGDRTGLSSEFKQSLQEGRTWGSVMQGVLQGVGQRIYMSLENVARGAIREIDRSIDAASDLAESVSKAEVVFRENAAAVMDWSETTATAIGQSRQQALEAAGTFGNLFSSMGMTRDVSADMSMVLVNLASDLASFNNADPSEMLVKLRAGLVGEVEPLRALGINMNATTVEAMAMSMGLAASTKELTEQDKVLARYQLILRQSANAQGDFARTADGTANAQRRLIAQLENYRTLAGRVFEPFRRDTINVLADLLERMEPYGENIFANFALGLANGLRAITPILYQLRSLFAFWLQPGSPPRLLPDLMRWGTGAANAYLEGWTKADFDIFGSLVGGIRSALSAGVGAGAISDTGMFSSLFSSRSALAGAVAEFATTGRVSEATFANIRDSAAVAGVEIEEVARAYFRLSTASADVQRAQDDLTRTQERYNAALRPISDELSAIDARRQELRDQQRIEELKVTLRKRSSSAEDKELAMLELRSIELLRQQGALEEERDTVVDVAQTKLDAAQAEEQKAQELLQLHQANLAQVTEYNQILGEQKNLLERMAAEVAAQLREAQAEAKRLANEAAAALNKEQQAAEQLANAQLGYKLAVADTPEQIALLQAELAKYNPTQVEYWQILTQIAGLEERLRKAREGGPLLPEFPPLPSEADFGGAEKAAGELEEAVTGLSEALQGVFKALGLMPEESKIHFTAAGGYVETFADDSEMKLTNWQADILDIFRLLHAIATGDWDEFWAVLSDQQDRYAEDSATGLEKNINDLSRKFVDNKGDIKKTSGEMWAEASKALGHWQSEMSRDLGRWLADTAADLQEGGGSFVDNLWAGISEKWDIFKRWWAEQIQGVRDAWPGSEPKDPSSPLRNLADAGRALIENIQTGIDGVKLQIPAIQVDMPVAAAAMGGGMTINQTINIQGAASEDDVYRGVSRANDDLLREYRARGRA